MTVDSEEGLRQMMLAKSGKSTRFRAHLVTIVKRPAQLAARAAKELAHTLSNEEKDLGIFAGLNKPS